MYRNLREGKNKANGVKPPSKTPKPSISPKGQQSQKEDLFNQLDEETKAKLNLLFGEVEIRRK